MENTVRPARPDSSRLAERPVERGVREGVNPPRPEGRESTRPDRNLDQPRVIEDRPRLERERTVIERSTASNRGEELPENRSLRSEYRTSGGIGERSTLTSINNLRSMSSTPHEAVRASVTSVALSPSGTSVIITAPSVALGIGSWGGYHYSTASYYYPTSSYYFGFASARSWSVGFGFGWASNVYYGSVGQAWLVGNAVHLMPHHHGFAFGYPGTFSWGYYHGGRIFRPFSLCYRSFYTYRCGPRFCRVSRPYWYFAPSWYAYYPSSYGFYRYVYDGVDYSDGYSDGYDRGYDKGYKRGYGDGAEDASAFKDDRRRDRVGVAPRAVTPDSSRDRYTDARTEFGRQMTQGHRSFAQGDYEAAVRAYKEAVILEPNSAPAKYELALGSFAAGKYSFGAFAVRRAVAVDAESLKAVTDLRKAYNDNTVFRTQLKALADEAAAHPADGDLQLLLGYVMLFSGDAKGAAAPLEAALKANPQDTTARALYTLALNKAEEK